MNALVEGEIFVVAYGATKWLAREQYASSK